jgi:hypothetical protein
MWSGEPMVRAAWCVHDLLGRHQLNAEVDELTLTHRVVVDGVDERSRTLRRNLHGLLETRRWAIAYRAAEGEPRHRL